MISRLFFEALGFKVRNDVKSFIVRFVLIDLILIIIFIRGVHMLLLGKLD